MKRISLMLALFLTLSFGAVYAGPAAVCDLGTVDGLYNVDTIGIGFPVTFHMHLVNDDGVNKVKGATNGFRVSSSDGATWTLQDYGPQDATVLKDDYGIDFNLIYSVYLGSWDGMSPDTIGFGGSVSTGYGIPPSYDNEVYWFTLLDGGQEGSHICIDSSYYPPSGTWAWAYGGTIGTFPPIWGGPYCYVLYTVPDLNVAWDAPTEGYAYAGSHCDAVVIGCTVHDRDLDNAEVPDPPADFTILSGPGAIASTGPWTANYTYAPTLGDVGAAIAVQLGATDAVHPGDYQPLNFTMNLTNEAPIFTAGDGGYLEVGMGNTGCIPFATDNVDCDPGTVSIVSVTPAPFNGLGAVSIVGGQVCFATATGLYPGAGDGGQTFEVVLEVTDGGPDKASSFATMLFNVLVTEPYEVQIEKTHNTLQGMHTIVDVTVNAGSEAMGGFDILIAYDASALHLMSAIPGDYHTQCGWEYFDYRFGPFGNCGNQCPSGMVRVVGIAETNNGYNHPTCLTLPPGAVLFSLDFLVSDDRTLECMYVPIRFYWMDCGDNSIAYHPSDDTLASVQGVSRYVLDLDLNHIENMFTGFPTFTGVQWECLQNEPNKPVPIQFVDFVNGGVDIVCADSIDARGDINLNGTSNEIADAVLFSNYFIQGLAVFNVNMAGQIAATDVNADGLTLSVADLVYLIRIIVGDALPYPKVGVEQAAYVVKDGVMSIDREMGAAFVVLQGDVAPRLLADNMEMKYAFDGANTRVLISKIERGASFTGDFLAFGDANVVSFEGATYDGAPVSAKLMPTEYQLHQNYPNPFNSATTIAFALPFGGDYTLTIYNVTGQKVTSFAGTHEAGMVTVDWDASDQASGVYFYKLDTQDFSATKKMVYLK